MSKTFLIHNPRCSKSREAKALLEKASIEFEVIDYLKDGLKKKLLQNLPGMLKLCFKEMVRTKEDIYKDLKLGDKKLTDKEWINVLIENPILLERPIFIMNNKAVIARPPDLVKTLFK